ncbi:hypothetical protein FIV04_15860 (plasmid) [Vibrio sp. THAF190c]|nr:hypothetical protein FIV04_15860 [Vibrio sp. THAF190c]
MQVWFCAGDRSPTQSSLLLGDDGLELPEIDWQMVTSK